MLELHSENAQYNKAQQLTVSGGGLGLFAHRGGAVSDIRPHRQRQRARMLGWSATCGELPATADFAGLRPWQNLRQPTLKPEIYMLHSGVA